MRTKPFLASGNHIDEDTQKMYAAWRKAMPMTAILWSQPYIAPEDY